MNALARLVGAIVLAALAGGGLGGCSVTPAEQEAIRRAWEEREAERARVPAGKRGLHRGRVRLRRRLVSDLDD